MIESFTTNSLCCLLYLFNSLWLCLLYLSTFNAYCFGLFLSAWLALEVKRGEVVSWDINEQLHIQPTCSHTNARGHMRTQTLSRQTRNLTPQRHENGKEDGSRVVEEVWSSGCAAGCAELPEVTGSITQRTHGEVQMLVTHLQAEEELRENWNVW